MIAICNDPSGVLRTLFLLLKKQCFFFNTQISEWHFGMMCFPLFTEAVKTKNRSFATKNMGSGLFCPQMIDLYSTLFLWPGDLRNIAMLTCIHLENKIR